MNIKDLLPQEKAVSTKALFTSDQGDATATVIQILQDERLKEHVSEVPALLFCINGKVVFGDENGANETLLSGDYVKIAPKVKHWVDAISDSQLILFK